MRNQSGLSTVRNVSTQEADASMIAVPVIGKIR